MDSLSVSASPGTGAYARFLAAGLARIVAERGLLSHSPEPYCHLHDMAGEKFKTSSGAARYTCDLCLEELCKEQLALAHEWARKYRMFAPAADLWR